MTNTDTGHAGTTTGTAHDASNFRCPAGPAPARLKETLKPSSSCPAGTRRYEPGGTYPDSPAGPVEPLTAGRLRRRPTGPMGLPIPAMNGRPGPLGIDTTDFLSVDTARVLDLARKALCGICAEPVRDGYAFLSGPAAHQARRTTNPPAHEACLLASMGLCPYINRPGKQRATGKRVAHFSSRDMVLAKPDVWVLGVTDRFHIEVFEDTGAVHVVPAAWTRARTFRYVDGCLQETDQ